jgi:hypothetical protein
MECFYGNGMAAPSRQDKLRAAIAAQLAAPPAGLQDPHAVRTALRS